GSPGRAPARDRTAHTRAEHSVRTTREHCESCFGRAPVAFLTIVLSPRVSPFILLFHFHLLFRKPRDISAWFFVNSVWRDTLNETNKHRDNFNENGFRFCDLLFFQDFLSHEYIKACSALES